MTQITQSAVIAGLPDTVWPLVTEATYFKIWYAFGGAEIELQVGGFISLHWDEHGTFEATVESVVRPKLFSFRWQPEPSSLVEITLQPEGNDSTRVQIMRSGELAYPEQSALAWQNGLKILADMALANQSK